VCDKPRIALVTNGNYFSNLALSRLLALTKDKYNYRIIVTTGLRKERGNRLVEAVHLARKWGWRYSAYKISTYVLPMLAQLITGKPKFVGAACRSMGLAHEKHKTINAANVVGELQAFSPDLLISFSCPYKISSVVLDIPTIGCLNVHSSLLPAYAGVCTYVHVLAEGESKTGVTVHEMVEKFDAGRVLSQVEVNITKGISVFELFAGQCRAATDLLLRAVEGCIKRGTIEGDAQDLSLRSYCGEPTASDIGRLRCNGYSLMSPGDLKCLFGGRRAQATDGEAPDTGPGTS